MASSHNKTPQDVLDAIKRLYDEGASAGETSRWLAERGYDYSRNSVIGIRNRRGWKNPRAKPGFSFSKRISRNGAPPPLRAPVVRRITVAEVDDRPIPEAPNESPWAFFDLRSDQCRWITDDGPGSIDSQFCGAPVADGKPFCPYHCRMAYRPTPKSVNTWPFRR